MNIICFAEMDFQDFQESDSIMQVSNLLISMSSSKVILCKIYIFNPLELLNYLAVSLSFPQPTSYFLTCSVVFVYLQKIVSHICSKFISDS